MSIFKAGDKIHDFQHGEGVIDDILGGYVYLNFKGNKLSMEYQDAKIRLSFKPYTLEGGGFSQERPNPEIEKGTVIYVKDNEADLWFVARFHNFSLSGLACVEQNGCIIPFGMYSLENPLT